MSARVDQVRYLITGMGNTTTYTVTAAYLFGDSFKLALEYKNSRNSNTLPVVLTLPDNGNSILLQAWPFSRNSFEQYVVPDAGRHRPGTTS